VADLMIYGMNGANFAGGFTYDFERLMPEVT
jgi:hypothetical protein